jgi:hypothetical protein
MNLARVVGVVRVDGVGVVRRPVATDPAASSTGKVLKASGEYGRRERKKRNRKERVPG